MPGVYRAWLVYPKFLQEAKHGSPNEVELVLNVTLQAASCALTVFQTRLCFELGNSSLVHRSLVGRLCDYVVELLADTGEASGDEIQLT